jgi:hypothetical protein
VQKIDSHFSIAKLAYLCSRQEGCTGCPLGAICGARIADWPQDPAVKHPPIESLRDLYDAAQERYTACQCPTLTVKGLTNVQRFLGMKTSIEKESVAIQQGNYPFAHATNMKQSEYTIFAIPYLRWIKERSCEE